MINKSAQVLAYIGDAVLSLQVREYLVKQGITKPQRLLDESIKFVSAVAQAEFIKEILNQEILTTQETTIFRRAYNYKFHSKAKNADINSYKYSTGLEALWGYWYLDQQHERLEQMWDKYKTFQKEKYETIHLLQK